MVVISSVACTELMGMAQARWTSPLMWTEQAPHWAMPQPYLVPVNPSCSRSTQSNGISPPTFTSRSLPFTFNLAMLLWPPIWLPTSTPTPIALDTSQLSLQRLFTFPCFATSTIRGRRSRGGPKQVSERDLLCDQRHCATPVTLLAICPIAVKALLRPRNSAFLAGESRRGEDAPWRGSSPRG